MMPSDPGLRGARAAELSWRDGIPRSTRFDDTYFSSAGGPAESRHVFLAGNGLPARFDGAGSFTIAETGFGTGLNFLSTWQAWRDSGGERLHYISIEGFPLRREDLAAAVSSWPEFSDLGAALLQVYPPPLPGMHRLLFDRGAVCLDLVFHELAPALELLLDLPELRVDAWYLDGFAPSRNPDMWCDDLFRAMSMLGGSDTTFATFTAAGEVRRGLAASGFLVEKRPGFAGKREMLRGRLVEPAGGPAPARTPWHLPRHQYPDISAGRPQRAADRPASAVVVGAGLAGAAAANAIARRGIPVVVLERDRVGAGASGNSQGTLYTRLSHRQSALNDFSLHSFCFSTRLYRQLLTDGRLRPGADGELCGSLQLRPDWGPDDELFETVASLPGLAQGVSAAEARSLAGIPAAAGLFYPESGWMHPPAVCRALLDHPAITVRENCGDLALARSANGWHLCGHRGDIVGEAPVAVIACGTASAQVAGADWIRLQSIRGQTSEVESRGELQNLRCVICHEGYLPPARQGAHCLGATFDIEDADPSLRRADHAANIEQAARALPALAAALRVDAVSGGRVGFRCASPDYLPIAGAVPDADAFCEDFAALRRNARRPLLQTGRFREGLYISTGHGSRGLTSTPLAGEMLAAAICGEPGPVPAALVRALAPARFLVRDLSRNRR